VGDVDVVVGGGVVLALDLLSDFLFWVTHFGGGWVGGLSGGLFLSGDRGQRELKSSTDRRSTTATVVFQQNKTEQCCTDTGETQHD